MSTGADRTPHRTPKTTARVLALALVVTAVAWLTGLAPTQAPAQAQASGSQTHDAGGPRVHIQSVPVPTSTLAVINTIGVGTQPYAVAVNDIDDTVYVTNNGSNTVSVIDGRTGILSSSIAVGSNPQAVAVNQADDTVYIANTLSSSLSIIEGATGTVDDTIPIGDQAYGVAVNQTDDTIYVTRSPARDAVVALNGRTLLLSDDSIIATAGFDPFGVAVNEGDDSVYVVGDGSGGTVRVINGPTATVSGSIVVGGQPRGVAVNQTDDTVYVTNNQFGSTLLYIIDGRTWTLDDTLTVGTQPFGVAIDQGDDTVYVVNQYSGTLSVVNGRTATVDDTIDVGDGPRGVTVDQVGLDAGLVYVSNSMTGAGGNSISVIARVAPTITPTTGEAFDSLTLSVDVPQVSYDVADATVTNVYFDDTARSASPLPGDNWSVQVPRGSGTVDVTVKFEGGLTASAGTFTYGSPTPPGPDPLLPPSAPRDVSAVGGDRSAVVSWSAPASAGSFPVSNYRVTSTPAGGTCLVNATSCTVPRLTNGTTYTFTVEALNGAGWGPAGGPSNPVTPGGVTPAPDPQPLPEPLTPGQSLLQVNGKTDTNVTVDSNTADNGIVITGEDWSMDLDGLGPDGTPLELTPEGVLRLETEREVDTQGTGFLPNSEVDLYVDPPVLVTDVGSRATGEGIYVGTVRTDLSGNFTGTATLPEDITPGEHVVQAIGYSPTAQSRAMSLGVIVDPWLVLNQGTRALDGRHDRIRTTGTTGGIAPGVKLTPWIRYAGQTSFQQGKATITVQSDGAFRWSRQIRKSKDLTGYVSYNDTKSNEVVWVRIR